MYLSVTSSLLIPLELVWLIKSIAYFINNQVFTVLERRRHRDATHHEGLGDIGPNRDNDEHCHDREAQNFPKV